MNLDSTACSQELPTIATWSQSNPNTNQLIRQVDYLGPPASVWWGDAPSAHRGPGLHVLTDLGAHVPTHPLVLQNSAPTSTLATRGLAQATWGNWRGIIAYPDIITYPAASADSYEYPLCARHCLSLKINMNKPLSSFILLSLQVRIFRLPPAAHRPLLPVCLLRGRAAMPSFLPR